MRCIFGARRLAFVRMWIAWCAGAPYPIPCNFQTCFGAGKPSRACRGGLRVRFKRPTWCCAAWGHPRPSRGRRGGGGRSAWSWTGASSTCPDSAFFTRGRKRSSRSLSGKTQATCFAILDTQSTRGHIYSVCKPDGNKQCECVCDCDYNDSSGVAAVTQSNAESSTPTTGIPAGIRRTKRGDASAFVPNRRVRVYHHTKHTPVENAHAAHAVIIHVASCIFFF